MGDEPSFWDKAGSVLLNGIDRYVDAEHASEIQKVHNPTVYASTPAGSLQGGRAVGAPGSIAGLPSWAVIGGGLLAAGLVAVLLLKR